MKFGRLGARGVQTDAQGVETHSVNNAEVDHLGLAAHFFSHGRGGNAEHPGRYAGVDVQIIFK